MSGCQSAVGESQGHDKIECDVQVGQRPATVAKDDRLDISTIGKCRSDPARMRAGNRQRGRGRHSLDIGRDLKRAPTIDETVLHSHHPLRVPCSTCNMFATDLTGAFKHMHFCSTR